jgi:hypothetical protein
MEVPAQTVGFGLSSPRRTTRHVPSRIAVKRATASRCELDPASQALRHLPFGVDFAFLDAFRFNW